MITSDESLKGLGAYFQRHKSEGPWILLKHKKHINILQLIAAKYAILTFNRLNPLAKSIHMQMDNVVALSYLIKMGGHRTKFCLNLAKRFRAI